MGNNGPFTIPTTQPMPQSPGDGAERNKNMDERLKNIPEVEPDKLDLFAIEKAEKENDGTVTAMDEFIRRHDAIEEVKNAIATNPLRFLEAKGALESIPPADVAPVKHGHWTERVGEVPDDPYYIFRKRFYCSVCGDWQTYGKTDYCPMCGASMESERDG